MFTRGMFASFSSLMQSVNHSVNYSTNCTPFLSDISVTFLEEELSFLPSYSVLLLSLSFGL